MTDTERALTELFGDCPRVKIIEVLVTTEHPDLNITDIAEDAGIARSTVYDHLDALVDTGAIRATREVNGAPLYTADQDRVWEILKRSLHTEPDDGEVDSMNDTDQAEILRALHDRYTSLEHAVEESVQDLRLGRNRDDVAVELQMALENNDAEVQTHTEGVEK
jgi:Fe2+ or Zn2+ uptake regulation protein